MITLNSKSLKELQEKLDNEKIIFWKNTTDLYFNKETVVFLYNNFQSLVIHSDVMKKDGWLYDETQDNLVMFFDKKNKKEIPFYVAEFRKNI